jgi:hypothetical protein
MTSYEHFVFFAGRVRDEIYQTFNAFAGKAVLVALSAHRS